MNSIEDLLNSLLQNSPDNTVRAASGGLMGSPMQNSPAQNSPMQSNPMANALTVGGGMQPSNATPFGQQFNSTPFSPTGSTSMQPGNMAGGGFSGNVNAQSSRFGPMAPLSVEEANRRSEFMNAKEQPMPQMGGMSPSYGGGIGSLMPQQSPYGEQSERQPQDRSVTPMRPEDRRRMAEMQPEQREMLHRQKDERYGEQLKQQEMQSLMEERRRQFDQQRGPNPYQTATPLDPNDPMIARTRGVSGGQQRMNPFQQLMGESRGMRAATQPYTPVQGQRLTPGATPLNPAAARTPGNFAMPVQGQNNTSGKQSLSDLVNASNVSSAGRRRLV